MSLMPRWYSTGFGLLVLAGQLLAGSACVARRRRAPAPRAAAGSRRAPPIWRDLGNLLLMCVLMLGLSRLHAVPHHLGREPAARDRLVRAAPADRLGARRRRAGASCISRCRSWRCSFAPSRTGRSASRSSPSRVARARTRSTSPGWCCRRSRRTACTAGGCCRCCSRRWALLLFGGLTDRARAAAAAPATPATRSRAMPR